MAARNLRFEEDLESCPIVYMHIPKTAGTSFIEVLKSIYPNLLRGANNQEVDKRLTKSGVTFPPVVCGHFNLNASFFKSGSMLDHALITTLRDPVERVLSQIYYLKNNTDHMFHSEIKGMSITKLYNSKSNLATKYGIANYQTYLLSGHQYLLAKDSVKFQQAMRNLQNRFTFYGLCEYFDDFLQLCYQKFGWDHIPEGPYLNVSPSDRNEAIGCSVRELEMIKQCNRYDIQLYEWAKKVYEEAYARAIIPVTKEVAVAEKSEPKEKMARILIKKSLGQKIKSIVFFWRWSLWKRSPQE
jgi:hypothetical protein